MFLLVMVSICGVTTCYENTDAFVALASDSSLKSVVDKVKFVLQDLDASTIAEKYHLIEHTKGLLLLPLCSVCGPEMSELSKNI